MLTYFDTLDISSIIPLLIYLMSAGALSGVVGGLIASLLTSRATMQSAIRASRLSYITAVLGAGQNFINIQRFLQDVYDESERMPGAKISDVTRTMWFVTAFSPAPKIRARIIKATASNDSAGIRTALEDYLSGNW